MYNLNIDQKVDLKHRKIEEPLYSPDEMLGIVPEDSADQFDMKKVLLPGVNV